MSIQYPFIPYVHAADDTLNPDQSALGNYLFMNQRRTVRDFSDKPISESVIRNLILAAGTAPSGAHKQPWTFCAVSNQDIKKSIREAAEKEEYDNYHGRMSEEWIRDLAPLGTDWKKEFLEIAPWLIIVFKKPYEFVNGQRHKNYYVSESVGIACGFLIQAIHEAGLICLTHTPSPMNFLQKILNRPEEEKAFLLVPVGYPSSEALVPDIKRKKLEEIAAFYR